MINVQNVSKRFGNQVLFTDISFHLNPGDRAGLVGRNGHGKTTLLRIIAGQEPYDGGGLLFPKHYRIGCLDQIINFTKKTVLKEGCRGLPPDQRTDDHIWKVKKILTGLGFSEDGFSRHPDEFSSGYRMRISLAKVLVSEPNLLLLDEPTNFLDILSIRWLIGYLNQWKNELIVISHNRYFMDSVTSVILGVHRQTLKKVKGSTKTYYSHIAKEEEIYEKLRINQAKKSKQMDDFISRFRAKARHASLVQSRKKAMEKVEPRDKLEAISSLSFSFNYAPERAKNLMETNNLSFSYSGFQPYLIDQFDLTVSSRDRICVIGKNGQGKSTLLRLLAGKLTPQTGEIKMFPQTRFSYFEQAQTEYMDDNLTVEEQIITSQEDGDRQKARDICGSMMFSDDDALKPTSVLSGGEKSRVLLGKMLVTSANLILMDEPTQHLDIESCEALMNAILSFPGAVIIVTHNERILRKVATRLIVFQRDRIFHFHDEYNRFLEQIGWEDETFMLNQDQINKIQTKTEKATLRKEMRQRRAEFIERRSQTLKPYLEQIQELEQAIGSLEIRIEGENKLLVTACHVQDANDITRLSKSIQQAQENLEKLYEFLLEQEEMYEKEKARFQYEESELLHRQG